MTAHYARIHDTTLRQEFDRYQAPAGQHRRARPRLRPGRAHSPAEWIKHHLSRITDTLPNGYCGRPPQQDCPHPNACLTCPDFQTTPEFLDIHRRQASTTLTLIARADANGQTRHAASLRQVQANLERIIPALEALPAGQEPHDDPS